MCSSDLGRQAVVAFEHGYHGRTNLTMGLTAKSMPYKHRMGPFAPEIYRAPMAYPYRWLGGAEHCAEQALQAVRRCSPMKIPADFMPYYDEVLRDITIRFRDEH